MESLSLEHKSHLDDLKEKNEWNKDLQRILEILGVREILSFNNWKKEDAYYGDQLMYGTPIQIRIEEEQVIISNRCILPEGWTAETLMQPHDSIPYNPDIANVFYRAGYIETWGQGIQKICDECIALGAELPKYEIIGTGLRVYFPALKSALIDQPKAPNRQDVGKDVGLEVGLAEKIIELILEDSEIKMSEMAEKLEVTTRTIEREMKKLRESGRVLRVGGKRYGHWEVR